uniref:Uncharacterized protein n=1 Tax=Anguilla anguilla TaxID=7936 RepID=A0A0E9T1E3_ANGAN
MCRDFCNNTAAVTTQSGEMFFIFYYPPRENCLLISDFCFCHQL